MEEAIKLTQQLTSYRLNESKSDKTIEQKLNDIQKIYTRNDANFKDSDAYQDLQRIQNSGRTSDYLAAEAIASLNENVKSSFAVDVHKGTNDFSKYLNFDNASLNMNFNIDAGKIVYEQGGFKGVVYLPSELYSHKDLSWNASISNESRIGLLLDTIDWFNATSQAERNDILKGLKKARYCISKDKINEFIGNNLSDFVEGMTGGLGNKLTRKDEVDELQGNLQKISSLCFIVSAVKTIYAKTGADNIALGPKLSDQLYLEEWTSIWSKNGNVKSGALRTGGQPMNNIKGTDLKDENAKSALKSYDNDLANWSKMKSATFHDANGDEFQFHYYQNVDGYISPWDVKMKWNETQKITPVVFDPEEIE